MNLLFKDKKTNHLLELDNLLRVVVDDLKSSTFLLNYDLEEVHNLIRYVDNLLLVKDNDDGILPAGKTDECFYCGSKVGKLHNFDCVIITRKNKYSVMVMSSDEVEDFGSSEKHDKIGTLIWDDPISWDKDMCEYHKNDSSWCSCNSLDKIKWLNNKNAKDVKKEIKGLDDDLKCSCGLLEFKFEKSENWLGKDHRFHFIWVSDGDRKIVGE